LNEVTYASASEIRSAFVEYAAGSATGEVPYAEIWDVLSQLGIAIRGTTPKRQRDAVWRALASDARIERCAAGVFRLKRDL
jgi:hypothetical protein